MQISLRIFDDAETSCYDLRMAVVSAFVLAGGKSSRMGSDKAFLEHAGKTLLDHALEIARRVSDKVVILGSRERFAAYGPVIEDIYRNCGPLSGIHAALSSTATELNLILAVDLPLLSSELLQFLLAIAESCDAQVTVPKVGLHYEPLCAVYRKSFFSPCEAALRSGNYKIDALYGSVPVRAVTGDELAANGFPAEMFRNINTPLDWQEAKRELQGAKHL